MTGGLRPEGQRPGLRTGGLIILIYLIVESVSFVLDRDLSPINPKKTIVRGHYIDNDLEHLTMLENVSQFHYLDIFLFPWGMAKNAFPGLTIFKIFWSLVCMDSRFIAVNMHYAKFTLWTPKLQILAKSLRPCPQHTFGFCSHTSNLCDDSDLISLRPQEDDMRRSKLRVVLSTSWRRVSWSLIRSAT